MFDAHHFSSFRIQNVCPQNKISWYKCIYHHVHHPSIVNMYYTFMCNVHCLQNASYLAYEWLENKIKKKLMAMTGSINIEGQTTSSFIWCQECREKMEKMKEKNDKKDETITTLSEQTINSRENILLFCCFIWLAVVRYVPQCRYHLINFMCAPKPCMICTDYKMK